MPITRRGVARGLAVIGALVLFALFSTGCELTVEDDGARADVQRTALSSNVTALPDYDAAVSAIDFDPPLKLETLIGYQKPVKLLAAVENKGTMPLSHLTVEARVITQRGEVSVQNRLQLERLSPGETKVVEFSGMPSANALPKSPYYRVRVSVEGQQSGSRSVSNSREVLIRVSD